MLSCQVVCLFFTVLVVGASGQLYRDITIDQGVVRGNKYDNSTVYAFFGIPYATTPKGEDKFKAPLAAPIWPGVFNATQRNIICPQMPIFSDSFMELNRTVDCLIANVFLPETPVDEAMPVFVYIHGGGFLEGYSMIFDPTELAAKGMVVVSINYRLGVHGFLCLGTELAPGNAGFKDMVAGLQWVKNNIQSFGGDPNNIALGGSSAGGMAVELLLISPLANDLFHKVVAESGAGINLGHGSPLNLAEIYANHFNVQTNGQIGALEAFYRTMTDDQLNIGIDAARFTFCVETHNLQNVQKFMGELPSAIVEKNDYQKRPYLTGFTPLEGLEFIAMYDDLVPALNYNTSAFFPQDLIFTTPLARDEAAEAARYFYFRTYDRITEMEFVEFMTDTIITHPQYVSARRHAKNNAEVYMFLFNFNGTVNLPSLQSSPIWGPGHVAQSLYIQEYDYKPLYDNMTATDYLVQERLRQMWFNFIKYGNPTPAQTSLLPATWLPVTADTDNYLEIDAELTLRQSPLRERFQLWDNLYETAAQDAAEGAGDAGVMERSSFLLISLALIYVLFFK